MANARIVTPINGVVLGQSFPIGVEIKLPPGWHTYWRNPGDSGEAVQLRWQTEGLNVAETIAWPMPQRIPYGPLINLGYKQQVLLTQRLIYRPTEASSGFVTINLAGRWLVCEEVCIPEEADLSLRLPIVEQAEVNSVLAMRFDQQPIPQTLKAGVEVQWLDTETFNLTVDLPGLSRENFQEVYFLPFEQDVVDLSLPPEVSYEDSKLAVKVRILDADRPSYDGLIWYQESVQGQAIIAGFEVPVTSPGSSSTVFDALQYLLLALLGGLLLNIMPCVFPVLSIKVLALLEESAGSVPQQRAQGWWYTLGVILSFLLIAGVLMLLRGLGEQIGWGFQLQNPLMVTLLAMLFLALGLNLSGFFELKFALGTPSKSRSSGFNAMMGGVLAVLVAAPCTAPFMGAALGFALTHSVTEGLIVFTGLGFGMALPFLLLAHSPNALSLLPKPGQWMITFKEACAFLMYATSIWLSWLLIQQVGSTGWLLLAGACLQLVILIWFWERFGANRWGTRLIVGFLVAGVGFTVAEIRQSKPEASPQVTAQAGNIKAMVYDPAAVADAALEGPVFVNFTADWCITCKVNEAVALGTDTTQALFLREGVRYFVADWTNEDPMITQALSRYGRVGVPLYLVFHPDATNPVILPQILTETMIAQALLPPAQSSRSSVNSG